MSSLSSLPLAPHPSIIWRKKTLEWTQILIHINFKFIIIKYEKKGGSLGKWTMLFFLNYFAVHFSFITFVIVAWSGRVTIPSMYRSKPSSGEGDVTTGSGSSVMTGTMGNSLTGVSLGDGSWTALSRLQKEYIISLIHTLWKTAKKTHPKQHYLQIFME